MNTQTSPLSNPRVRSLFEKALHLPAAARPPFITKEAHGDAEIESLVLSLLQSAEDRLRRSFGVNPEEGSSLHGTATFELLQKLAVAPPLDSVRYKTEGQLGRGGMGAVMSVRDEYLNRQLAMKVMLDFGRPSDPIARQMAHQMLGRFLEEAQVTSQLDHPGVVPVHELGIDVAGKVFFTMRLVKGQTLKEVFEMVASGTDGWDRARALEAMLKVCDTMAYSHDKGVLHRDLKPANVMVGRFGEVYVMDWGLAKVLGQEDRHDLRIKEEAKAGDEEVTVSARTLLHTARKEDIDTVAGGSIVSMDGQQLGTPTYMAPEQARSEPLDARADIYSLGAMLYTLLAGRPPYVTPGVAQAGYRVLEKVVAGPPEPLTSIAKDVPAALVAIVERAMARNKVSRYQKVQELAADLRAYLDGRVVQAYQTGAFAEMKMWVRRNKPLAFSIASAAVFLIVGLVVSTWSLVERGEALAAETREKTRANEATQTAQSAQREAVQQREAAERNREEAEAAKTRAEQSASALAANVVQLKRTIEQFEQTKSVVDFARVMADADGLLVPRAARVEKLQRWLIDADRVLAKRVEFEDKVKELARSALPVERLSDEERRAYERNAEAINQQSAACMRLEAEGAELARIEAVRRGSAPAPAVSLPAGLGQQKGETLEDWVQRLATLVQSFTKQLEAGYAVDGGPAGLGAVLAETIAASQQLIVAAARFPNLRYLEPSFRVWHAWTLAANGLDSRAIHELTAARTQVAAWSTAERTRVDAKKALEEVEGAGRSLQTWIELAPRRFAEAEAARRAATTNLRDLQRQQAVFAGDDTGKLTAFLFGEMQRFLAGLEVLEARRTEVAQELTWVQQLARVNEQRPAAWTPWQRVEEDLRTNPHYRGQPVGFGPAAKADLVPIEVNPRTGLWEFYDLRSAWDGRSPIDEIMIPTHDKATGEIENVTGAMGIVLVLLPAGQFRPGGSSAAAGSEPVPVLPFLIARHELTQGQWERLWRRGPDGRYPSTYCAGKWATNGELPTRANPVENFDLAQAAALLADSGMTLPTEAQWEYACRARTSTAFAFAEAEIARACNDNRSDDYIVHAPVGDLTANEFGLHAMHGNVAELIAADLPQHAGGSFFQPRESCTSSSFFLFEAGSRRNYVGLRAARAIAGD